MSATVLDVTPSYLDLVLGVDGGGSRTVCVLAAGARAAATGSVFGRGVGGASNRHAVGRDVMVQSLDHAVDQAFAAANLRPGPVAAACLGMAGADRPDDRSIVLEWARERRLARSVIVENDGRLVLAGGTPDDWGLAVIAGTGSFALARSLDGQTRRAGGWGYLFGDEGSAYALALHGLRAVAQAHDGSGPATLLTSLMQSRLHVSDVKGLIPVLYSGSLDRAEIARLAEDVTSAAESGDTVASAILDGAARELADTGVAAARLLTDARLSAIPVAVGGSALVSCRLYAERLMSRLQGLIDAKLTPVQFVTIPAEGAVRLAQRLLQSEPEGVVA